MDTLPYQYVAEALALGLLIGIERYKSRSDGEKKIAGVRTFPLIALLGVLCSIIGLMPVTISCFLGFSVLLALGYWRESTSSIGLTTEVAALLTFWLGYLIPIHEGLAISTGIVLVLVLAHKQTLHNFVRGGFTETELYDSLKFLLVVFVVYPLLPDRYLTSYNFVRPSQVWLLVILVSTIGYSGYILIRIFGGKRGLQINALVGGLVSTTAITVSLAQRASRAPELARLMGVAAVMGNAVQAPRLLVLVLVVDPALAKVLAIPFMGMFVSGIGGALFLGHLRKVWKEEPSMDAIVENPYQFWPAFKFALLLIGVIVISRVAQDLLGEQAIYWVSAVAGLADVSAISISVAELAVGGEISTEMAAISIFIALCMNAIAKIALSLVSGSRAVAFWLTGGLVTMLTVGFGLFWLITLSA